MQPSFFGPASEQLFGAYHPPQEPTAAPDDAAATERRDCGVVLCYPVGEEYLSVNRAFHSLTRRLSQAGFPCLAFDFFGCGDSAGESADWRVEHWVRDVALATAHLERLGRVSRVCLVGLRFGAAVAMRASPRIPDVAGLVLWEPVVKGAAYLDECRRRQKKWVQGCYGKPGDIDADGIDVLGFRFSSAFQEDLGGVDLEAEVARPDTHVLLLHGGGHGAFGEQLVQGAQGAGQVECAEVEEETFWQKSEDFSERGLVPRRSIDRLLDWLGRTFPAEPVRRGRPRPALKRDAAPPSDVI